LTFATRAFRSLTTFAAIWTLRPFRAGFTRLSWLTRRLGLSTLRTRRAFTLLSTLRFIATRSPVAAWLSVIPLATLGTITPIVAAITATSRFTITPRFGLFDFNRLDFFHRLAATA
jgi:hypothetical protein